MTSSDIPLLRVSFVDDAVSALVELDWEQAALTAEGITQSLPINGKAFHGIYSGSEVACFIPPQIRIPRENATTRVLPRDIAYYRVRGGSTYGEPEDISEICWFYDRDARPSTPDGPVAVNVFGRFTEGWDQFAWVCRSMRDQGSKAVRFELV